MKTYSTYILCLLVIFSTNACNNESSPDIDTSLINITAPQVIPAEDSVSALLNPGSTAPVIVNNPSAVVLNPPHGQPGHNCAIPVGSPLNGKPNTAASSSIPSATPVLTASPQMLPPSNNNSSVALNPPHGQPGHDCAIPVGSPLNGKRNAAATSSPAPPATPVLTTSPQMLPFSNSNNSVALNPPHGQPGHNCAIPVGQPL